MVVALGLAIGPSLGGALVDTPGWRAIFFVNVPVGVAAYPWCRQLLPELGSEKRQRFDWPGAVPAFGGLGTLFLSVSRGQSYHWSWPILALGLGPPSCCGKLAALRAYLAAALVSLVATVASLWTRLPGPSGAGDG